MKDKITILFVENDIDFSQPMEKLLILEKFNVITASSIDLAKQKIDQKFDIAIFDTNLSEGNPIELLRFFKKKFKKPVILLTVKNSVNDRIVGLDNNSDYYLPKPVVFEELLAVIKNLLRKYDLQPSYWVLDELNLTITDPENKTYTLTITEYNIFKIIYESDENYISREEIYQVLGKKSTSSSERSGDMLISRIRKKIDLGNKNKKTFTSIRGKGYKFLSKLTITKP
jgi:DNA-binding response OmpR family regulator